MTFLRVWLRVDRRGGGDGVGVGRAVGGWRWPPLPGAPPAVTVAVSVSSSLIVVVRATWPSGSNFSSVRVVVSQFDLGGNAHDGLARPQHLLQHPFGFFGEILLEVAAGRRVGCWTSRPPNRCPRFAESTLPRLSTTETLLACKSLHAVGDQKADGIDGGRRATGALPLTRTKTEAVGLRWASVSSRFSGMTIMTRADSTWSKLADGAGQLALHGAGVIGPLHEIGNAEIGLVENLESHSFAARNALAGHLHAHLINLVGRNHDGAAAAADLVGDLGLVQGGDDFGGLAFVQFAVEQGEFGAAGPKGHAAPGRRAPPGWRG